METLISLFSGNIGTLIFALVLWKSGMLKYLMEQKNGNGNKQLTSKIDELKQHFNEDTSLILQRIEKRLDDVVDGINYIKGKLDDK